MKIELQNRWMAQEKTWFNIDFFSFGFTSQNDDMMVGCNHLHFIVFNIVIEFMWLSKGSI